MPQDDFREALDLADALATFANLEPDGVPAFREKYPNFAPSGWWEHRELDSANEVRYIWRGEQSRVKHAWQTGFRPDDCVELIVSGAQRADLQDDIAIHDAANELPMDDAERAEFFQKHARRQRHIFDYQRAVMFLHVQVWRVAFCLGCSRPFVRSAKGSKYCSQKCFDANRSRSQLEYWRTTGTKLRAKKNKRKANR